MSADRRPHELGLLRKIAAELVKKSLPETRAAQFDPEYDKFACTIFISDGYVGVTVAGDEALADLIEAILARRPQGERGVNFKAYHDQLLRNLADGILGKDPSAFTEADVLAIESAMTDWIKARIEKHIVLVPCLLSRQASEPFSVGPVKFVYRDNLRVQDVTADATSATHLLPRRFDKLIELATAEQAFWIACVEVDGCDIESSVENADLSVDLAIVFLQLAYSNDQTRNMSRLSSRRGSSKTLRISVSDNGRMSVGTQFANPGIALGDGMLAHIAQRRSELREAVGKIVTSFATGNFRLPVIEKAWCDAAYWLHQGLAEPLDTIAVAKLETAIEILMRAESSSGGKKRIEKAIEGFLGVGPNQPLFEGQPETSREVAKRLAGDRSRILHGTWSTLGSRLGEGRSILESLTTALLRSCAMALDAYVDSSSPKDDIDELITWNQIRYATAPSLVPTSR